MIVDFTGGIINQGWPTWFVRIPSSCSWKEWTSSSPLCMKGLLSTLILWLLNFRIYNFDINPQLIKIFHTHLKKHTHLLTKGNQIYNIDYSFLKEHPLRKRHDMVVQGWWLGEFKLKKLFVQVSVIPIQYYLFKYFKSIQNSGKLWEWGVHHGWLWRYFKS